MAAAQTSIAPSTTASPTDPPSTTTGFPTTFPPTTILICPPGSYVYHNWPDVTCNICPPGYFCTGYNNQRQLCATGTYNLLENQSDSSDCLPCPNGSYCPNASTLVSCPLGTHSEQKSTSFTACVDCLVGYFCPTPAQQILCPGGNYNTEVAQTSCKSCPVGKYCTGGKEISSCAKGTVSTAINASAASTCQDCDFNFFSNETGSSECFPCPDDKITYVTGATSSSFCFVNYGASPLSPTFSPPSPTPVSELPIETFPPVPTDLTPFPVLQNATIDSFLQSVEIANHNNNLTLPCKITIESAHSSLGTFIGLQRHSDQVRSVFSFDGTKVEFLSSNITALVEAVKTSYVFSVSSDSLLNSLYMSIAIEDSSSPTPQSAVSILAINELNINRGPVVETPFSTKLPSFNITRGNKFSLDLGKVFSQPFGLPLQFSSSLADGFSIPPTLKVSCDSTSGNCTVKGVLDAETDLTIDLQCTDQFYLRSTRFILNALSVPIHMNDDAILVPVLLRPGQSFQYALPTNLFVSSTAITYNSIRLAGGFPLPTTLAFDPPNTLRGNYPDAGLLQLQIQASDLFYEAVRNITLNFTNIPPFCRNDFTTDSSPLLNSSTTNIKPIVALQEFERIIELSSLCADNDNDPMSFTVDDFSIPSWVRATITPGGFTSLPQSLRLVGTSPKSSENTNITINIVATDSFASVPLTIPVRVEKNLPPIRIAPLPNYTIHPGDVGDYNIDLKEYFEDPNGDQLTIEVTIVTEYAKTWLTAQTDDKVMKLYLSAKPGDQIEGEYDDAKESDEFIRVRVVDPFGNYSQSTFKIEVRFTLWQKLKTAVYILVGATSLILTIISWILLYPYVFNFFRAGSRTMKCPLNAKNRKWMLPEEAAVVSIMHRDKIDCCSGLVHFTKKISVYLFDELTLSEFPLDPPSWCEPIDKGLKLANVEPKPDTDPSENIVDPDPVYSFCYVRVFNRRGLILVQFPMKYHEITKDWNFEEVEVADLAEAKEKESRAFLPEQSQVLFPSPPANGIVSDLNTDYNKNNNDHESAAVDIERRFREIDTKVTSIDVAKDEEIKKNQEEMRELRSENQKNQEEIRGLKAILERMLSSSSSLASDHNNNHDHLSETVVNRGGVHRVQGEYLEELLSGTEKEFKKNIGISKKSKKPPQEFDPVGML